MLVALVVNMMSGVEGRMPKLMKTYHLNIRARVTQTNLRVGSSCSAKVETCLHYYSYAPIMPWVSELWYGEWQHMPTQSHAGRTMLQPWDEDWRIVITHY